MAGVPGQIELIDDDYRGSEKNPVIKGEEE